MSEAKKTADHLIESHTLSFGKNNSNGYEVYKKLLTSFFSIEAVQNGPFESTVNAFFFRDMVFISSMANTEDNTLTRHSRLANLPGSDYIVAFFCRSHSTSIKTNTLEAKVQPEQLVFVDMSKPFSIHASGINMLSLSFSRTLLESLIPGVQDIHGWVFTDGPHKELLLAYMKTLEVVAARIRSSDSVHVTETAVRMIANCLLHSGLGKSTSSASNLKLSLLDIKNAIDSQIENPRLNLEMLMDQFHVSRATLYRMFEPYGGVAKYIQRRKLDFAFRELSKYSNKKQNISMLAYRLGYSHASVFTRAFFARFGINPSEVRKELIKKERSPIYWRDDENYGT